MIRFVWEQLLGQFRIRGRDIKGWVDTDALRRVGVELDPEIPLNGRVIKRVPW
jgi:hypothetical protein